MASVDRVVQRPGGRSAQVRGRVIAALRQALESGDPAELAVERLAARAGVHKVTIYRRWLSTAGLVAELLAELTPVETPLPDTGSIRGDLAAIADRVAATVAEPTMQAMLRIVAASTEEHVVSAARNYWAAILDHTAEAVRRAQARREVDPEIDPVATVESLLAPIYLRLLVTRQPIDPATIAATVDRTLASLGRQAT